MIRIKSSPLLWLLLGQAQEKMKNDKKALLCYESSYNDYLSM